MVKKVLILLTLLAGLVLASASAQPQDPLVVEITNKKYNHDCFWGGPKGIDYGLLPGSQPIQTPVLYPDQGSTYFVAQFKLPAKDAILIIHGDYPHERYFSFTAATQFHDGTIGGGNSLRDDQIVPDPKSTNPFISTNNRDATPRGYTIIVEQGKPTDPPGRNTVYTSGGPNEPIHLAMRNYISDSGYDGTGNAKLDQLEVYGLPTVTLIQLGKEPLRGEEMCKAVSASKGTESTAYPLEMWDKLVASSGDPENAPAKPTPVWERFWNTPYSVNGLFVPDPATRVAEYPPNNDGGFANNPDTSYIMAMFSLRFGPVYVIRGKMPVHPETKGREKNWTPNAQVRYWSACTGAAPHSGLGWACVWDEHVPVDENGWYTLVVSKPEDRPVNANEECGVKWLKFGKGEGEYPGARHWVNVVYMRFMDPNPDWAESPTFPNLPLPNPYAQDAYTMKEYFPRSHYETKAQYESHGCLSGN
jgi:hypothetical protein